jgi:hypothetical protein
MLTQVDAGKSAYAQTTQEAVVAKLLADESDHALSPPFEKFIEID